MEPWDISKATFARNAGLRKTRRVCVFHDKDQENESTPLRLYVRLMCCPVNHCYPLLKASIDHTGIWLSANFYKLPAPLVSSIIFTPDGLFYTLWR